MQISNAGRAVTAAGGLIGALGVIAAAAASHGADSRNFSAIASICLSHGPLLVALGLFGISGRWFGAAAWVLIVGTVLFAGDLLVLEKLGHSLFPLAAPIGGTAMIAGWILLSLAAVLSRSLQ